MSTDRDEPVTAAVFTSDTTRAADALVEEIRRRASTGVGDALVFAQASLDEIGEYGPLVYLLAELHARLGHAHEALDLIDRAVWACRRVGDELTSQRYEVGRVAVLEDLGRHDEAISAATAVIHRLQQLEPRLLTGFGAALRPATKGEDANTSIVAVAVRALSNRALSWESVGAYESAFDDYELALRILPTSFEPLVAAQLQINRSNVLDLLGRSADAIEALEIALPVVERDGDRDDLVKVIANLAMMACRRGEFERGLSWFARAESAVEPGTVDACAITVETAEVFAGLGALDEAIHRYRDALAVLADSPISWLEGRAWLGLGITLARRGERAEARAALRTAIDAFQASDNLPLTIAALLELSSVESADPALHAIAVDQVRRAATLADVDRWPVQACMAQLRLGELDDSAEGERLLRSALRLSARAELAPLSMRAHQRLGRHLLRRRRVADARPHVEAAVALAETLRSRLSHHSLLRLFPAETSSCFDDLVQLRLLEGDIEGAATAADRGKSRSLLRLNVPGRDATEVFDETAELELELDVLYDRLLGATMDSVSDRERLERRARTLEQSIERQRVRLADSTDVGTTREAAVGHRIAGVTLMFQVVGDELGAFVSTDDGTRWWPAVASLRDVAGELERFHSDGRRTWAMRGIGIEPTTTALGAARHRLERLGAALLDPIRELLAERDAADTPIELLVIPTGGLWAVPFAALVIDGRALIDRACVTVSPSPTVARTRPPAATGPALVVGVADHGIPGAGEEAVLVAACHAGAELLLDADAHLDAVRRACDTGSPRSIVHLASHGVHRPHAPLQSGVRLSNGWLTSHRASQLRLDGSLVVLSACDTGRSAVLDGGEILGAQYGFLAGGARSVVMSLWPAHDARTIELMATFHQRLADGSPVAAALRSAQLELRQVEPHPWWWASFMVAGS